MAISKEQLEAVAAGTMTWEQVLEQEQAGGEERKREQARKRSSRNRALRAQLHRAGRWGWYPTGRMSTALWMRQRELERSAELRKAQDDDTDTLLDEWTEMDMSAEEAVGYGLSPVTRHGDTTAYARKQARREKLGKTAVKKHEHTKRVARRVLLTAVPELPKPHVDEDRPLAWRKGIAYRSPARRISPIEKSIARHARRHGN
jgi:hypothetical protein